MAQQWLARFAMMATVAMTALLPTAETFLTAVPTPAVNPNRAMSWLPSTAAVSGRVAAVVDGKGPLALSMTSTTTTVNGDLRGKVAVVTGSSRGIGKGIAVTLGERGCTVYVTGRSAGGTLTDKVSWRRSCILQCTAAHVASCLLPHGSR